MQPLDDRPQIGMFAVEPESLEEVGVDLATMITELGADALEDLPEGTPQRGWRVLALQAGAVSTIGAPVDEAGQSWRLGQVVRGRGEPAVPRLSVHPNSFPRRPSRRDRAGSLTMRWPEVTRSAPDLALLMIDVVNEGAERWYPQGDSFTVFAALARPEGRVPGVSFGYIAGGSPASPLDPGEYSRVRAVIDSSQWRDVAPGVYEVHAVLVDIGLRSEDPLRLDITRDDIQRFG